MGIASQGEGSGKGSSGHQAKHVHMGMRRVPHYGPVPVIVNPTIAPTPTQPAPPSPPQGGSGS